MGAGAVGPRRVDVGDELRRIDASMDHARRGSSEENALVAEVREGSVVRTGTGRLVTTSNSDAMRCVWTEVGTPWPRKGSEPQRT